MERIEKKFIVWMTGLSGAGKTTLAHGLKQHFDQQDINAVILDGDLFRKGLNADLGFNREDRRENIRRMAEVARMLLDAGIVPIVSAISPYTEDRSAAKHILAPYKFIEVFIQCSLQECERRDPKGLYKQARQGRIPQFTGISDNFEPPENPAIIINTEKMSVPASLKELLAGICAVNTGKTASLINI